MHFYSSKTTYTVIKRINGSQRRFAARDNEGCLCLLAVIDNSSEAKRLLPTLLDWKENEYFTEFIEFFPYSKGIIAVFAYYDDGLPLSRALDDADPSHRAVVLRSLFESILAQNLPQDILAEALRDENLLVSPSGKVRLLYDLPRTRASEGTVTLTDVVRRITGVDSQSGYTIFNDVFIESLSNGSHADYRQMYEAADEAAASLEFYTPTNQNQNRNGLTVQILQQHISAVKEVLLERWAIILAVSVLLTGYLAVGFLFYAVVINPHGVDNGIKAIGTVVISDGS